MTDSETTIDQMRIFSVLIIDEIAQIRKLHCVIFALAIAAKNKKK